MQGKIEKVDLKQGWGEWAGQGVDTSGYEARRAKAEAIRQRKIEDLKKGRADAKMKGV